MTEIDVMDFLKEKLREIVDKHDEYQCWDEHNCLVEIRTEFCDINLQDYMDDKRVK